MDSKNTFANAFWNTFKFIDRNRFFLKENGGSRGGNI